MLNIIKIIAEVPKELALTDALVDAIDMAFKNSASVNLWHKGTGPLVIDPQVILQAIKETPHE